MSKLPAIVFALGLLLQITKIGELLLRSSQQEAVQRNFMRLAQRLEKIDPAGWLALVTSRRWIQLLLAAGFALVLLPALPPFWRLLSGDGDADSFGFGAPVAMGTALLFFWSGSQALQSLHAAKPVRFAVAIVGWLVASIVLTAISLFAFAYVMSDPDAIIPILLLMPVAIAASAQANFMGIIATLGLITLSLRVMKFGMSMLLAIVRGLVWRIAEYNKGAWAAVTAIVTVAAGIAMLFLQ